MKANTASREFLINEIISKLNEMPLEQVCRHHNDLPTTSAAFVVDGEVTLFKKADIKDWAIGTVTLGFDEDLTYPVSYTVDGNGSETNFSDEADAIMDAFTTYVVNTGDFEEGEAVTLPVANHVIEIAIDDPDTKLPVDITVFKCAESNGLFAVDSSFILTLGDNDPIVNPMTGLWTATVGD
jgi:hypothetical protein